STGDFVTAGGVTGTVEQVGLLATTIDTPDNIRTIVGNNKILSDTIQNFSANPHRRVDLLAQLHHTVDPDGAMQRLRERLGRIPNVARDPAPQVEILQFTAAGPLLAVRPSCSNEHYWQVYFDTNRAIRETFATAGYPAPEQLVLVRSGGGGQPGGGKDADTTGDHPDRRLRARGTRLRQARARAQRPRDHRGAFERAHVRVLAHHQHRDGRERRPQDPHGDAPHRRRRDRPLRGSRVRAQPAPGPEGRSRDGDLLRVARPPPPRHRARAAGLV